MIIVTPHLVKPLEMAKYTLPTDAYVEPNDFEFFLQGAIEGKGGGRSVSAHEGLDGEFGHVIPEE